MALGNLGQEGAPLDQAQLGLGIGSGLQGMVQGYLQALQIKHMQQQDQLEKAGHMASFGFDPTQMQGADWAKAFQNADPNSSDPHARWAGMVMRSAGLDYKKKSAEAGLAENQEKQSDWMTKLISGQGGGDNPISGGSSGAQPSMPVIKDDAGNFMRVEPGEKGLPTLKPLSGASASSVNSALGINAVPGGKKDYASEPVIAAAKEKVGDQPKQYTEAMGGIQNTRSYLAQMKAAYNKISQNPQLMRSLNAAKGKFTDDMLANPDVASYEHNRESLMSNLKELSGNGAVRLPFQEMLRLTSALPSVWADTKTGQTMFNNLQKRTDLGEIDANRNLPYGYQAAITSGNGNIKFTPDVMKALGNEPLTEPPIRSSKTGRWAITDPNDGQLKYLKTK